MMKVDGNVTERIVTTGFVDPEVMGEYLMSYEVADLKGNEARKVVRIIKIDDSKLTADHKGCGQNPCLVSRRTNRWARLWEN